MYYKNYQDTLFVNLCMRNGQNALADKKMLWLNRQASGLLGSLFDQRIIY